MKDFKNKQFFLLASATTDNIIKDENPGKERATEFTEGGNEDYEVQLAPKKARHTGWHVLMHENLVSLKSHTIKIEFIATRSNQSSQIFIEASLMGGLITSFFHFL